MILLFATIIWGSAFISQKLGTEHISPFTFQAVRCFLAVLGLLLVIAVADLFKKEKGGFFRRWKSKKLWLAGILCGIPLFLACNLQQFGLAAKTDPGKSGFLTAMYIVIVPVIGIFFKRKPTIMVPVSVAFAAAGLYCISCVGVTRISTGDILTIGCAFAFAFQILFVDKFAHSVDPLRLNLIQALICSILSGIMMLLTETPTLNGIVKSSVYLSHAGFLSMGAAYALQIIGQKKVEPAAASLIMSMEAVFSLLFGICFGMDSVDFWKLFGCGLMLTAVILSQIPVKRKKTAIL